MKVKYCVLFVLMIWCLLTGCRAKRQAGNQELPSRTYYESLQLDTPEETIQTFVHAFQQHDFVTVYLVLAPAAQQEIFSSQVYLYSADFITEGIPPEEQEMFERAVNERLPVKNPEHFPDALQHFDAMMLAAAQLSLLPFYFPGEVTILDSHNSETVTDQATLEVTVEIAGINERPVFRLVQSPGQKWRIFQVVWPGGDESNIPWAVTSISIQARQTNSQIDTSIPRTVYERLDLSTPEMAVQAFTQAFQKKDFPTVFWVLDQAAQREWLANLALMRFGNLVNISESGFIWQTEWGKNLLSLQESGVLREDESLIVLLGAIGSGLGDKQSPYLPLVMEQIGNSSYLFDQVMLAANEQYFIDLHQPIAILETTTTKFEDGEILASVIVMVEGNEEKLDFQLRQSLMGRWRVLQVSRADSDENLFPWDMTKSD